MAEAPKIPISLEMLIDLERMAKLNGTQDAFASVALQWAEAANARIIELTELLQSAGCIAARRGEETAWERFLDSLREAGISSVTPRTYRILPHDIDCAEK